jgi:4-hydroxythreonine-4-phosphate dehydrogenase
MQEAKKIKVGISIGDLNGIGCELILKTFLDPRMLELCTPVVFASNKTLSHWMKLLNYQLNFNGVSNSKESLDGKFNVVNVWKELVEITPGVSNQTGGTYALKSLQAAVQSLKEGSVDVLLTAPIDKSNIQSEEFKFPGHTDYLAQQLEGKSLMFMISATLRVGLLTDHIPVKSVSDHINSKLIEEKVQTISSTLKRDFGISKPKIALLGINPHSGDQGVIGKEDDQTLRPTIVKLQEEGTMVFGPYAADGFFGSENYKNFDAVLAAYHDQGLIPFKTLSFGQGVNYTAGLSKIRTSPDHGTAFDIAGKGVANEQSFKEALFLAIQLYKDRSEYDKLSSNPLEKVNIKNPKKRTN